MVHPHGTVSRFSPAALDGLSNTLRVIYIKSYKVASTTISAILKRIQEEKGLRVCHPFQPPAGLASIF